MTQCYPRTLFAMAILVMSLGGCTSGVLAQPPGPRSTVPQPQKLEQQLGKWSKSISDGDSAPPVWAGEGAARRSGKTVSTGVPASVGLNSYDKESGIATVEAVISSGSAVRVISPWRFDGRDWSPNLDQDPWFIRTLIET